MAAGLTVHRDKLEPAMARLSDLLAQQGAGSLGPGDLKLDGLLMPTAATVELCDQLEQAGPFGASAPAPRFALPDMAVTFAREVGSGHLKLTLSDGGSTRLDAIAFGAFDTDLGPALSQSDGGRFHVAGRLEQNHWGGRTKVQLRLDDAAPA
jgi:single-stranded-DNA-specific exonuclease